MVPVSLPGVKAMHAVDVAGVHPLLLAVGSERYTPYQKISRPQEILTQANAILGFNQASLAKYLIIADGSGHDVEINDEMAFFDYCLRRVDWSRDLHFQTKTTMDTLDYSGDAVNRGSKLVIAAAGPEIRQLAKKVPEEFKTCLVDGFKLSNARLVAPGIVAVSGEAFATHDKAMKEMTALTKALNVGSDVALMVIVDDADFCASSPANWLWVTFTRSNPSHDIYGFDSFYEFKHWGCKGPLIIDARIKPHHAPPLIEDDDVARRVEQKFSWIWGKK
jgi:4-hydroxy-3-polyprenylbenzoate decarboxylase